MSDFGISDVGIADRGDLRLQIGDLVKRFGLDV